MNRQDLARMIDHTLLAPDATLAQVQRAAEIAVEANVASLCVSSSRVADAVAALEGSSIPVCTVIGFPSGAVRTDVKVTETERAAADGAREFDMVIQVGRLRDGDVRAVEADIAAVRAAVPHGGVLKVILETAMLTPEEIVAGCRATEAAGAHFVKTATGFGPGRGATVDDVRLMAQTVPNLGVKASKGISDAATALSLVQAGATRLGMSRTLLVLREVDRMTTRGNQFGGVRGQHFGRPGQRGVESSPFLMR